MKMKSLLVATLFCSTAIAPVAFAQTTAPETGQQTNQQQANQQACDDLVRISDENSDRFQREWIEGADAAVQRADATECAAYVERAEEALEANQTAEAGSRIVVEQPEPRVSVEQEAPDVAVSQAEPQVSVNQGQPEVIVRQAQPTVTVEVPQPTVTIDQPEPEIIVRMPEPDVNVATPEPDVEVSQNQPEVSVQQEEPQVNVEVEEPTVNVAESDQAEVEVEQEQPVVRQQETDGEAQVNVQREEPAVSYERAEPNVEVNSEGEPNVQFTESGEPNVRFEENAEASGADGDRLAAEDEQATADDTEQTRLSDLPEDERDVPVEGGETTASIDSDERAPTEGTADLRGDGGAASTGDVMPIQVGAVIGRDVHNGRGEELGTVSRVVTDGEAVYAVLANGGFLGMGEREVALPMDRISLQDGRDELLLRGMTEEEIENLPRFDSSAAEELQRNQEIEVSSL